MSDSKILRIGIIQGLTEGALQTFVFLWSPALRHFAAHIPKELDSSPFLGLDEDGEPAYGLIFGAFMACGALGGMFEPITRRTFAYILQLTDEAFGQKEQGKSFYGSLGNRIENEPQQTQIPSESFVLISPPASSWNGNSLAPSISETSCGSSIYETGSTKISDSTSDDGGSEPGSEESDDEKPVAVELFTATCFLACASLLATPVYIDENSPYAFSAALGAFLIYEFLIGLYMPCEGVLRTIYMPNTSICSLMTMLRVIVNIAVSLGVISTNYIPLTSAFGACSGALFLAALLQLTLVKREEWKSLQRLLKCEFKVMNMSSERRESRSSISSRHPIFILEKQELKRSPLVFSTESTSSTVDMSPQSSITSAVDEISEEYSVDCDERCDAEFDTISIDNMPFPTGVRRRSIMVGTTAAFLQ